MKPQRLKRKGKTASLAQVAAVLAVSLGLAALLWNQIQATDPAASHGTAGPANGVSVICWLLVVTGITGTALASFGGRFGWLLLFGLQPLWIAYALATGQGGLVLGSVAYGAVQLNGFLRGGDPSARESRLWQRKGTSESCPS